MKQETGQWNNTSMDLSESRYTHIIASKSNGVQLKSSELEDQIFHRRVCQ